MSRIARGGRTVEAGSLELDFELPGRERLNNLLDLVGVRTQVVDSKRQRPGQTASRIRPTCESPFTDEPCAMRDYIPKLFDNFSVNSSTSIPGRININQAPRLLLVGIPGMDSIDRRPDHRQPPAGPEWRAAGAGLRNLAAGERHGRPGDNEATDAAGDGRRRRLPGPGRRLFRRGGPGLPDRGDRRRDPDARRSSSGGGTWSTRARDTRSKSWGPRWRTGRDAGDYNGWRRCGSARSKLRR